MMDGPEFIGRCSLCKGRVVKESSNVWCESCGAKPMKPIIEMDRLTKFESNPQLLNEKNLDD